MSYAFFCAVVNAEQYRYRWRRDTKGQLRSLKGVNAENNMDRTREQLGSYKENGNKKEAVDSCDMCYVPYPLKGYGT